MYNFMFWANIALEKHNMYTEIENVKKNGMYIWELP